MNFDEFTQIVSPCGAHAGSDWASPVWASKALGFEWDSWGFTGQGPFALVMGHRAAPQPIGRPKANRAAPFIPLCRTEFTSGGSAMLTTKLGPVRDFTGCTHAKATPARCPAGIARENDPIHYRVGSSWLLSSIFP